MQFVYATGILQKAQYPAEEFFINLNLLIESRTFNIVCMHDDGGIGDAGGDGGGDVGDDDVSSCGGGDAGSVDGGGDDGNWRPCW